MQDLCEPDFNKNTKVSQVGVNAFCYGVFDEMSGFRAKYRAEYMKDPYVDPSTRWRWEVAQTVTPQEHDDAVARIAVYEEWFLKEILQTGKRNTLLVLPIMTQEVDYRDVPPELIGTITGEMKYHSRVSNRDEYLPVTLSLLGPPGEHGDSLRYPVTKYGVAGSDMALINAAIRTLKVAGRPTRVVTGPRMFASAQTVPENGLG
ncbi:MAG: hypothetical protein Q9167_004064 [Letrouitia subvulpina]